MTGGLNTIATEWQEAWQRLRQRWQETTTIWSDSVGQQFEREFWQPLETQVAATQREMERLAYVIAQARRGIR